MLKQFLKNARTNPPYQLAKIEPFNNVCAKQSNLKNIRKNSYLSHKQTIEETRGQDWRVKETLTKIPKTVLAMNKYKKFPNKCKAVVKSMWERSKFWIALKSTIEVASFTTPSPNTRLYSKGVSSWLRTWCIHIDNIK
jgi:hypothetical protein